MKSFKRTPLDASGPPTDTERLRQAARRVGLNIAIIAAVMGMLSFTAMAFLGPRFRAINEQFGAQEFWRGDAPEPDGAHIALIAVIYLTFGIVAAGMIGWLAARPAVAPMAEFLRLQRNFVADASHELRTPLTVINARLQVLERRLARDEPVDEIVRQLRTDTNAMADLLSDLLLAAEGSQVAPGSPSSVQKCVNDAVRSLTVIAEEAGQEIVVAAPKDALVQVPETALTRCVVALVDNALQHSPPHGTVTVSVTSEGEQVAIRVQDTGEGIGIGVEEVFERFAHSEENARRRSFGLGLALVKDITSRYGGSIAVESTSTEGTCMLLTIPYATRS